MTKTRLAGAKIRPTALGVHIFAGGFTLGVKQAGFDILGHLEDTKYGVESALMNWPDLDVRVGEENWNAKEFEGSVDLLYSNPPCAIFSSAGISTTRGSEAWRDDPRLGCWHRAFEVFNTVRPRVFALESVCQAYTKGREVVDKFTNDAISLGYSVFHVLEDAQWTGLPQSRKRFFFVAALPWLPLEFRFKFDEPPTIGQVLATVENPGPFINHCRGKNGENYRTTIENTLPGCKLSTTFNDLGFGEIVTTSAGKKKVSGRPGFAYGRMDANSITGAFIGDYYVHPKRNRFLGVNEQKAICGYPQDFKLEGKTSGKASLMARAVLPPVGNWLGTIVKKCMSLPVRSRPKPSVTVVDIRKPPGSYSDITSEYIIPGPRLDVRRQEFLKFACDVKSCCKCESMIGRTRVMSQSNGNIRAKLMFIGEAPGKDSAGVTGMPFYGDESGRNFETLLKSIGLSYDDVFVTNAILCNPLGNDGKNRSPEPWEIGNCSEHLKRVIELVNPSVIATLGNAALQAIAIVEEHSVTLSSKVGRCVDWYGRKLVPLYHPSPRVIASHRPMSMQRQDYKKLKLILNDNHQPVEVKVPVKIKKKVVAKSTSSITHIDASSSEKPLPGEGSGKFIQRLWMTGKYSPDELVSLVHANWQGRTTKRGDVYFNYRRLIDSGVENVPPWPTGIRKKLTENKKLTTKSKLIINNPSTVKKRVKSKGQILLTGSTPMQVGSKRTQLKIITAAAAWDRALNDLGYDVDWRVVEPGENLSKYKFVFSILNKPNSIASRYVHGAFWSLMRQDTIAVIDDWQTTSLVSSLVTCSKVMERLFRLNGDGVSNKIKRQIFDLVNNMTVNRWQWPVIAPILGKGDLSLLGLNADVIGIDPTSYSDRYSLDGLPLKKKRQWIQASLLHKPLPDGCAWPVTGYGWLDRGGRGSGNNFGGKRGVNAQPRLTEPELFEEYTKVWGILSPAHPHAGSSWWRVRYLMAADAGCVLSADEREAKCLGKPYVVASSTERVESFSTSRLENLARAQKEQLDRIVWPKERVLDALSKLIDERKG